jgi:hypothetical protein
MKRFIESHGCQCETMPNDQFLIIDSEGERVVIDADIIKIKQWLGY